MSLTVGDNLQLYQMDLHREEYADMAEAEKILFSVNMPNTFVVLLFYLKEVYSVWIAVVGE